MPGAVSYIRCWTFSATWRDGRFDCDDYRPQYRSTFRLFTPAEQERPHSGHSTAFSARYLINGSNPATISFRNVSGIYRHGQLDRLGQNHFQFRQRRSGRIYDRHQSNYVRAADLLGNEQRSSYYGWSSAWRRKTRSS